MDFIHEKMSEETEKSKVTREVALNRTIRVVFKPNMARTQQNLFKACRLNTFWAINKPVKQEIITPEGILTYDDSEIFWGPGSTNNGGLVGLGQLDERSEHWQTLKSKAEGKTDKWAEQQLI